MKYSSKSYWPFRYKQRIKRASMQ